MTPLVRAFRRKQKKLQRQREAPPEFLLELGDDCEWISHRITRRTPKRIFYLDDGRERSVSAEQIASTGAAFARHRIFYTVAGAERIFGPTWQSPGRRLRRAPTDALEALGLEAGASADDIRRAFRRLAFACHPDRQGGEGSAFIALHAAYIAALAAAP